MEIGEGVNVQEDVYIVQSSCGKLVTIYWSFYS